MTHEARLTQKRLEGEILKLLEGERSGLYCASVECAFCKKRLRLTGNCHGCPLIQESEPDAECYSEKFLEIDLDMYLMNPDAIPGALAIYLWLFEL